MASTTVKKNMKTMSDKPEQTDPPKLEHRLTLRLDYGLYARFEYQAKSIHHAKVTEMLRRVVLEFLEQAEKKNPPPDDLATRKRRRNKKSSPRTDQPDTSES